MKHEPNGVDDCLAHLMFKYRPGDNLDSSWVLSVTPDICLCNRFFRDPLQFIIHWWCVRRYTIWTSESDVN